MNPRLVPLNDIEGLREGGVGYPESIDGWRWLYRCRHERGLASAFVKLGRRVLVDVPTFIELSLKPQPILTDATCFRREKDDKPGRTLSCAGEREKRNARSEPRSAASPTRIARRR